MAKNYFEIFLLEVIRNFQRILSAKNRSHLTSKLGSYLNFSSPFSYISFSSCTFTGSRDRLFSLYLLKLPCHFDLMKLPCHFDRDVIKQDTEKSFRNLVKSTRNQIVFTIFRLLWNQKNVHLCSKSMGKWYIQSDFGLI